MIFCCGTKVFASDFSCDNSHYINAFSNYIIESSASEQNIKDFREQKLLLKNVNDFSEVDDFNNKDNIPLADDLLMLKINDGVNKYKICNNKDYYFLIYEIDENIKTVFFSKSKKLFDFDGANLTN
ncbi:MAG: hypothetical protein R3Y43_07410 [Alphaproteobacteria bacterium]